MLSITVFASLAGALSTTAATNSSIPAVVERANSTVGVPEATARAVPFGVQAAVPRLLAARSYGHFNFTRGYAHARPNGTYVLVARDEPVGADGSGATEDYMMGVLPEGVDYMSQDPGTGADAYPAPMPGPDDGSAILDPMSLPPPPGVNDPVPVYWNSEENRWLPTPMFQGTGSFQGGKAMRVCDGHKTDGEGFVGIAPNWMSSGRLSPQCKRMVRVVNMGSRRGPNLRVGAEMRFPVMGKCGDCPYNSIGLSLGAFREMTGGSFSPPTSLDVAWEFADGEA